MYIIFFDEYTVKILSRNTNKFSLGIYQLSCIISDDSFASDCVWCQHFFHKPIIITHGTRSLCLPSVYITVHYYDTSPTGQWQLSEVAMPSYCEIVLNKSTWWQAITIIMPLQIPPYNYRNLKWRYIQNPEMWYIAMYKHTIFAIDTRGFSFGGVVREYGITTKSHLYLQLL